MHGTGNVDNMHKALFLHVFCHCSFCRLRRASWQFRAEGIELARFCAGEAHLGVGACSRPEAERRTASGAHKAAKSKMFLPGTLGAA